MDLVGDQQLLSAANNLPEGVKLFSNQVSGHRHGQGRLGIGVLKHENGDLLKPLIDGDRRAITELSFYKEVSQSKDSDPLLQELFHFRPVFYGIWSTHIGGKDIKYLRLEDVSKNFENPSVMDIKMGRRTYDDQANEAKILSQSKKFPFGHALGIRILGMKVYSGDKGAYLPQNEKLFWRHLNPETILSGLQMYLTNNKCVNGLILSGFIHKLTQLSIWFSKQRKFKFIGSSLLFVYEGTFSYWCTYIQSNNIATFCNRSTTKATPCPICNTCVSNDQMNAEVTDICTVCGLCESTCQNITNCKFLRLAMIDFAHCYPSDEEDTNYVFGLNNLINYFKDLLQIQIAK